MPKCVKVTKTSDVVHKLYPILILVHMFKEILFGVFQEVFNVRTFRSVTEHVIAIVSETGSQIFDFVVPLVLKCNVKQITGID
jgi:hypothetical protein